MNNLNQKNRTNTFYYKFLSTLSFIGLGIIFVHETGHAVIKPLGNNSPTLKPKFFYGSNGVKIPIASQSSINSGGDSSQLSKTPKPIPPPVPKRSSSIVFMANLDKSSIIFPTSSNTKISSDSKEHKPYIPPTYKEPIEDLTKIINASRSAYKKTDKMLDNVLLQLNLTTK